MAPRKRARVVGTLNLPQSSAGMLINAIARYLKQHPDQGPQKRTSINVTDGVSASPASTSPEKQHERPGTSNGEKRRKSSPIFFGGATISPWSTEDSRSLHTSGHHSKTFIPHDVKSVSHDPDPVATDGSGVGNHVVFRDHNGASTNTFEMTEEFEREQTRDSTQVSTDSREADHDNAKLSSTRRDTRTAPQQGARQRALREGLPGPNNSDAERLYEDNRQSVIAAQAGAGKLRESDQDRREVQTAPSQRAGRGANQLSNNANHSSRDATDFERHHPRGPGFRPTTGQLTVSFCDCRSWKLVDMLLTFVVVLCGRRRSRVRYGNERLAIPARSPHLQTTTIGSPFPNKWTRYAPRVGVLVASIAVSPMFRVCRCQLLLPLKSVAQPDDSTQAPEGRPPALKRSWHDSPTNKSVCRATGDVDTIATGSTPRTKIASCRIKFW